MSLLDIVKFSFFIRRFWQHLHGHFGIILLLALLGVAAPARADVEKSCERPEFSDQVRLNARSLNQLVWNFHGVNEVGWAAVAPRIAHDIGSACGPATGEFSARLVQWQKRENIKPSGIIDSQVLSEFLQKWKSQRLLRLGFGQKYPGCNYGPRDALTEISADHDRTSREIMLVNKIDSQAYAAYKRMLAAARRDLPSEAMPGDAMLIFSAHRSPSYNQMLCDRDGRCDGIRRAKCSIHFTGRALDLVVGGKNGDTSADNRLLQSRTAIYGWLLRNAGSFGFVNYAYEPWHWEYVGDLK